MVALVLAEQSIMNDFDILVLTKLKRYNKPVKTKHLAGKLKVTRPDLVMSLNKLQDQGLIYYHAPHKDDDKLFYGWKVCQS